MDENLARLQAAPPRPTATGLTAAEAERQRRARQTAINDQRLMDENLARLQAAPPRPTATGLTAAEAEIQRRARQAAINDQRFAEQERLQREANRAMVIARRNIPETTGEHVQSPDEILRREKSRAEAADKVRWAEEKEKKKGGKRLSREKKQNKRILDFDLRRLADLGYTTKAERKNYRRSTDPGVIARRQEYEAGLGGAIAAAPPDVPAEGEAAPKPEPEPEHVDVAPPDVSAEGEPAPVPTVATVPVAVSQTQPAAPVTTPVTPPITQTIDATQLRQALAQSRSGGLPAATTTTTTQPTRAALTHDEFARASDIIRGLPNDTTENEWLDHSKELQQLISGGRILPDDKQPADALLAYIQQRLAQAQETKKPQPTQPRVPPSQELPLASEEGRDAFRRDLMKDYRPKNLLEYQLTPEQVPPFVARLRRIVDDPDTTPKEIAHLESDLYDVIHNSNPNSPYPLIPGEDELRSVMDLMRDMDFLVQRLTPYDYENGNRETRVRPRPPKHATSYDYAASDNRNSG
jgi:hypothetical protein